jgi:N-acyl homoserine lactone hydrolase
MKMHALSCGRLQMKRRTYFPDAPRDETIDLPVISFLIRHRQANVLFDTGCHPAALQDPVGRWRGLAKVMKPTCDPDDNLIGSLRSIEVTPGDVDVVICSHLHPDHCGCNAFFARATVICHARELAAARAAGAEEAGYLANDWDHPQTFDVLEGMRDLFGDGRVVIVPLPGHTPGSIGALVILQRSGPFLLASDAVSIRATLDRDVVPRNTWNADLLRSSFAEIRRIEAGGTTVICGHDMAQWQAIASGPMEWQ